MNNKIIPLIILAGTATLMACNAENSTSSNTTPTVLKKDAIAVVNGTYISKASLASLEKDISERSRGQSFPKEKLIDELIQRELLIQEAVNKQLDKSAEFTERLATIRSSLLSQEAIQNHVKSSPITDADLEAEYNKNMATSGSEYKARHILVKTEEEAKQLIVELDKSADFIELAKTKSTGPSGPKGGDLGWFTAGQMVPPFSEATIALADGKYTKTPVQTQFGWHVILKEGSRTQTPPPFESVKEQIRPMLKRQKMLDFLASLRKQATIEIFPQTPEKAVPEAASAATKDVKTETTGKEIKPELTDVENKNTAVEEVKADVVKKADDAKNAVVDSTKNAINKITESVQSATKDATSKVTETVEQAKQATTEKASKAITKTLDAVTQ